MTTDNRPHRGKDSNKAEPDASSQGFAPNSPPDLTKPEPGRREHQNPEAENSEDAAVERKPPADTGL